ncbi:effector-associated domain EAD1-containing protein [Burkholderia cenocepacia]|uniref:Effector-associated domain EAD1-containing protein n=1 Tax=Burkholderia cenocepacia TaxID=95486 RepID=A0ABD4UTH0_9BURK|nr:effector-associated domain EAD1-containing protein [Burkholderia cenocepacia]MCW3701434.1 effector-associated domain EAD1-containing protein [Burkholderia cenocepacia]MCW3709436.1 effector-associated domain EAD1-containing protein [Burkholderia cenocepacia]MCW3717451.1 effector-associated domain EAD1-containing protein [Burkholderia cenocepacia]MCW3725505.1 effector-associated domain EAD1-containing protein [Burkholderia cenocepacia]MCW3733501.1 effector-associated domain EAD1-containing pr
MRIEQAIYGEVPGRGHGLRASSPNASIAAAIASKLDLPDSVPPGIQAWSPFVRGFPIDRHYVLARTFLDPSASRGGMVLTHALIASLDDMSNIGSLATLFEQLAGSVTDCPSSVATLELEIASSVHGPATDLIGTANALTAQSVAPVVRLGVEGFEHLIDSLWSNLWPALRRTFAFRLSFGPNDVIEHPSPALVCTPEQLQARWTKHRMVQSDDQIPSSESARVLCGQRDVQPILALAKDLGLEVHTLRELSRLERLHTLLSNGESFDDLLGAIRLADGLSNQPKLGASIKDKLIDRFALLIPDLDCKQLLPLRNLALSGFANTQQLWSAVELLVSNLGFAPAEDSDLMEMVRASVDENLALPPWRAAVTAGLSTAARRDKSTIFLAIWRWAELGQTAFAAAVSTLPTDPSVEQRLAGEAPRTLRVATPAALLPPLLKKGWWTAYGAVLASTLPPLDAAGQQLKVDKDPGHSAGLRSAVRYASPPQMLECALAYQDLRLVGLCADLAATHPQMLANIRCDNVTEQKVWGAAIGKNSSLWNAPSNAISARDTVMAQLAEGLPVDTGLLDALALTPLADLSATPERAQLWSLLPTSQRDHYLEATASGWLEVAATGAVVTRPEPPLERAILASSSLLIVLERSSVKVDARLAIVTALPSFLEDTFITWLSNLLREVRILSHPNSEQLGTLIASRRWERAAKYLSSRLADHRPDLMPGLRLCADLLSFHMRWKFGISKPSATEKWSAFEVEARELYPHGPDSSELWSRAGGKNSDLPGWSLNGATRWHTALNSIRYGGRPTMRELVAVMCQDFPLNEKLRLYASDTDIVGWR